MVRAPGFVTHTFGRWRKKERGHIKDHVCLCFLCASIRRKEPVGKIGDLIVFVAWRGVGVGARRETR